jgi:hypothetical protein
MAQSKEITVAGSTIALRGMQAAIQQGYRQEKDTIRMLRFGYCHQPNAK